MPSLRFVSLFATCAFAACSAGTVPIGSGAAPTEPGPEPITDGDPGARDGADSPEDPTPELPGDGAPDASICQEINVGAVPREPDFLIVLDRSESMKQEFQGGLFPVQTMRWEPAVNAIDEVTRALEERVRFGLMVFPNEASRCAEGSLEVPIDLRSADAIAARLAMLEPGGATPLAITLAQALAVLTENRGVPDYVPRDAYVLLVTDGAPNCSATLSSSNDLDEEDSYAAVDRLREADIQTYVVGFDTGGLAVLDGLAQRGGTGDTQHRAVSDGPGLVAELESIAASAVSCTYELDEAPGDPTYVRVQLDGVSYPLGDAGWTLEGDRTVKLGAAACDVLRDGMQHEIRITVECEPVVVQ